MLDKVLIANRGEIAVRVIRTCRELGIGTVAVYSELDRDALHVRARRRGVRARRPDRPGELPQHRADPRGPRRSPAPTRVHPGYGFFSENADFARAVTVARRHVHRPAARGDRGDGRQDLLAASPPRRRASARCPGRSTPLEGPDEVVAFGEEFGWPVAIKAAFGGGGRGMKVVHARRARRPRRSTPRQREALAYFGRAECYVERYLTWPRHVEMQVLADTHGTTLWLGERDCSCQRRHQKLIEESPASDFPDERAPARWARPRSRVAEACGYVNAGTVEFLYQDGEFFFLEMNTRLQVEHPVTELVTGLDLVEWQLRIAAGEPLGFAQDDVAAMRRGHAIEVRVNAEDPRAGGSSRRPGR